MYSQDQMYDTYPIVFLTVMFYLQETDGLVAAAESVATNPNTFYLGINGLPDPTVDSAITIIDENDEMKLLDISDEERKKLWDILDKQCRDALGKGCADLLKEAEEQMGDEPPLDGFAS